MSEVPPGALGWADMIRKSPLTVAAAMVVACAGRGEPPPLEPADVAAMSYIDARAWLEEWFAGASMGMRTTDAAVMTSQERRWEQARRDDPRMQDLADPGTPTGLGAEREAHVSRVVLYGCTMEIFPWSWMLTLALSDSTVEGIDVPWPGVDSVAVDGATTYVYGHRRGPATRSGRPRYGGYVSTFTFGSDGHARLAKMVLDRTVALCRGP